KDVNWDQLNYHYYLPFELLAGRLGQDFFAASAQSYLNPIGYLPFYLMVKSGWHSVAVSIMLATAHSLSIGLLYLVARTLFADLPPRDRGVFSFLAAALGAATGVYWMTVGGSFLDPLLVPQMLAALPLLLREDRHAARRAALAGALFGAAAALKYSNAVYALAALPLALAMPGLAGASRLRACLAYVLGAAVAVGLLAGPWFALLMREFGNPAFPLLNAWFRSPHALPINLIGERFALRDPIALLAFPFRMVVLRLVGVWVARVVERLLPAYAARVALAMLLAVQVGMSVIASPPRWFISEEWSRRWFPFEAPQRALRDPALYLTVEILPMAVVAPFVHPASSFVNFRGQHSLPTDSPRLAALLERHRGHVRTLGRELKLVEGKPAEHQVKTY